MILIVAIGQKQPAWINNAVSDYLLRFPAHDRPLLREIKAESRNSGKTINAIKAAEAERIRGAIPKDCLMIALDELGKAMTTAKFSGFIGEQQQRSSHLAFLIGGPDGLDDTLKKDCQHSIRLSSMTLPHSIARLLLAEQLYRAWSIAHDHPYHRA